MVRWILAVALLSGGLVACGGQSPCERLCEEVAPKIEQNITGATVDCSDPVWAAAGTCEECQEVLADLYDVALTDPAEKCAGFFWGP